MAESSLKQLVIFDFTKEKILCTEINVSPSRPFCVFVYKKKPFVLANCIPTNLKFWKIKKKSQQKRKEKTALSGRKCVKKTINSQQNRQLLRNLSNIYIEKMNIIVTLMQSKQKQKTN